MQDKVTGEMVPVRSEVYEALRHDPNQTVFAVGDVLKIRGGLFRVRKITRKDLILRGIPAPEEEP